ncbi:hypothetical protein ACOSP7_020087 [Xanthoceras sorbifolium]
MELVQGEVDEFREIMGIINKEMDLVSLSDANLRRVFTMFVIANGVANGQSKPFTQADVDGLWCSSVDGMVAVARQRLVGWDTETQTKEQDPLVQASSMPSLSWPQNGCITLEWIQGLISTFKWASWKDPKDFWNLMPVAVVKKLIRAASKIMKESAGFPSDHRYFVFNGNYINRGSWGLEVLLVLLALKVLMPHRVYLLRGSNETKECTLKYGFWAEVCTKFGKKDCKIVYERCLGCFKALPLASVIANSVYTTHGGLFRSACSFIAQSSKGEKRRKLNIFPLGSLKELAKVNRFLEDVPERGILTDVLWSNPSLETGIKENTDRVCSICWGPDYTEEFLRENHLKLIIRSLEGPDARTGKLYTLFGPPSYPQFAGFDNVGSYVVLKPPKFDSPIFLPLKASKRPEVPPYDGFLYNNMDLDGAEDSTSVDSEEDQDLITREAGEEQNLALMILYLRLPPSLAHISLSLSLIRFLGKIR